MAQVLNPEHTYQHSKKYGKDSILRIFDSVESSLDNTVKCTGPYSDDLQDKNSGTLPPFFEVHVSIGMH